MNSCLSVAACVSAAVLATAAAAAAPEPSGARAEVAATMIWKSVTKKETLDTDGTHIVTTTIDQTTTLSCPVETYGPEASSYIDLGGDPGAAAAPAGGAGFDAAAMEKKFEACKKSGKDDMACAMEMADAMSDAPSGGAGASSDRYSIFYSEACSGRMVARNSVVSEHAGGGKRVIISRTEGEGPLDAPEASIVVETDNKASRTRYLFVSPQAVSIPRKDFGTKAMSERLQALPSSPVIVGPIAGSAKSGSFKKTIPGGSYEIVWTFQRKP